jgi:hypothetical protein
LSVGCRFACSSRCGGRVGGHVERALIARCEAQRDRRAVRSRVGGDARRHPRLGTGRVDRCEHFVRLPAATHSVGECSLLIAHQGEGRTAVAGIGVEQPHRSCPQRPPLAGRRASTDERIRLPAAARPVTASATRGSPTWPCSSPNPGRRRRRSEARQCLCRSPRSPDSTAFPGATAATLGPEREEASRVGSSAADPDECLVAEAMASRGSPRARNRSSEGRRT